MSKGIKVATWDPHIDFGEYPEGVEVISNIDDAEDFDIAVLVTAHKVCLNLDWDKLLSQMRTPLIYDGRRVLDLDSLEKMGWQTYAVGKPI
jgi:UDPglucose 6-dehydrogenase